MKTFEKDAGLSRITKAELHAYINQLNHNLDILSSEVKHLKAASGQELAKAFETGATATRQRDLGVVSTLSQMHQDNHDFGQALYKILELTKLPTPSYPTR